MWERFTERAKSVVAGAREQAIFHNSEYVRSEHLLLAICLEPDCTAMRALTALGVDLDAFVAAVGRSLAAGAGTVDPEEVAFTPSAKKVLEYAVEEAGRNSDFYIGTGHVLLGLLRTEDGVAATTLTSFNVDYEKAKTAIARLIDENRGSDDPS